MPLTPEILFGAKPITGSVPTAARIAPNGQSVTYLLASKDNRETLDLWIFDRASGEHRLLIDGRRAAGSVDGLTDEEKAERERRRHFAFGITSYEWHPSEQEILLPLDGGATLFDVSQASFRELTPAGTRQTDIRYSPRGSYVSFVRQGDLYFVERRHGTATRVTNDGSSTVSNGLAEFVAQEEMHRFEGYWWSADEAKLAYTRVDVAPITESQRYEIDAEQFNVVAQRYPYAGAANAEVTVYLYDLATGTAEPIDWRLEPDDYLARAGFTPEGNLWVQSQSRSQQRLTARSWVNGTWEPLFEERADTWINLTDNLFFDGGMVRTSERDGSSALYRNDEPIATGLSRVNDILTVDDGSAWITGWDETPTEQHLYRVDLESGAIEALTGVTGWHGGTISTADGAALISSSTPDVAHRLTLIDATGSHVIFEEAPLDDATHPYAEHRVDHRPSQLGTIENQGESLAFRLTLPAGAGPHPVVVYVYGGPGVNRVRAEYPPLLLQLFVQRGFGVFELDNRGSANRSKRFEDAIYRRLGVAEIEDQLAGVEYLKGHPDIDPVGIGLFGHSYGGYMTLMGLAKHPGVFAAGVSVAPVSDWKLYDTHYTERYLSTPAENPDGYRESGVFPYLGNIRDPLLLMHGMADDNVLFTHTTMLMKALQDAAIPFDLMTYPGAKHSMQEPSVATHRFNKILDFFERHLTPTRAS